MQKKNLNSLGVVSLTRSLKLFAITCSLIFSLLLCTSAYTESPDPEAVFSHTSADSETMMTLMSFDNNRKQEVLRAIEQEWHPGFIPMILELYYFANDRALSRKLLEILRTKTGQHFGTDLDQWYQWLWAQPENQHPAYASFKSVLYGRIDPRFSDYFHSDYATEIRLDEVRWGGVKQDGIPPLRGPEMIPAKEASYLSDDDIVFGVEVNGDVRAYPKRILAWHEMFVDTIGGVAYAGVYCTLCGSVVMYETIADGRQYHLGTSGFLYRSNKLMYDKATQSLWNSTWGRPSIGPLVGAGIELELGYIVTTTWKAWKQRHPETLVLSLNTGYQRNYDEGVAYQNYFSTQDLMFTVPELDTRLQNKDEVLALRFSDTAETLAIDAYFLNRHNIYYDQVGSNKLVILTDSSGANRVYRAGESLLVSYDGGLRATDDAGQVWRVEESALISTEGVRLSRLPARRAFWFGWYAAYNDTRLVK